MTAAFRTLVSVRTAHGTRVVVAIASTVPPVPPRIAVVAPSSPFPRETFEQGLAWLRQHAAIDVDPRCFERLGYLAGSDETRSRILLEALRDPEVRCLWAARGGYGAMRLLERHGDELFDALREDPKPLVGFSDVTALHALWARADVPSIHGPMVAGLHRIDSAREETWSLLTGTPPARWEGLQVLCGKGCVTGVARGGNLALVTALVGTPWQLDLHGAVLFLEDVNEAPYRVDRMLTTLRLARALEGVVAVVLGDFSYTGESTEENSLDLVLWERLYPLDVPVLRNAPFGHGKQQRPWASGTRVTVDATEGTVRFEALESPLVFPYGTLTT